MSGVREQLVEVMRRAYSRGLINLLGGNASVKDGRGFWITPSQVPKDSLKVDDLVYVDLVKGPAPSGRKPSMEWRMHKEIYNLNPEVSAVIHTHNPVTVALYSAGYSLDPERYIEAYSIGKCVSVVGELPPGSLELARCVAEEVSRCRVVVLLGHGVVAAAENLHKALDALEALEDISRIEVIKLLLSGVRGPPLPPR